jgi:hypothetical protein
MKDELTKRLNTLALKVSRPFCYTCYKDALSGRCVTCGSDDLMRHLPGNGVEYGTGWIVPEILEEIEAADTDSLFEDSVRGCYEEETKIGWLTYDTVSAIKELDPISWDIAKGEWLDNEEGEEILVSFDNGSTYYETWQIENFLEEKERGLEPVAS